jgi:hypothetical protein
MLVRRDILDRIVAGEIDTQFRLWRKPTVKVGGRLRTVVGELTILSVDIVDVESLTDSDAQRSGYASGSELVAAMVPKPVSTAPSSARARTAKPDETSVLYRVVVRYEGVDTRIALRTEVSAESIAAVRSKLAAMDSRSGRGPWTQRTLALISQWPGRRAPELAEIEGLETVPFKNDVRKLKELGLTVSLTVGYELSERGKATLAEITAAN